MSESMRPVSAGVYPDNNCPAYRSSAKRAPLEPPVALAHTASELTGPAVASSARYPRASDMTVDAGGGVAQGQRIIVCGRVTDEYGRPERNALVEVWQANAAGRYVHDGDRHDAPVDPHFSGRGGAVTDDDGCYQFVTIEPGAYPWGNHDNAWRPKHIHFSLFGPCWASRLVTQMYFPGDPLLALDPIFNGVPDAHARERLVAALDIERTVPEHALAYRFDIVLRGPRETPQEGTS